MDSYDFLQIRNSLKIIVFHNKSDLETWPYGWNYKFYYAILHLFVMNLGM